MLLVTVSSINLYICTCTGGRAYSNAFFGRGGGPIFLDDVQCSSSSSQLLECHSKTVASRNCLHTDDAGVGCEGTFIILGLKCNYQWCSYSFRLSSLFPQLHA